MLTDIYEIVDKLLYPFEIDMLLNEAVLLCPAMKRENKKVYPANVKVLFPNQTDEFYDLGYRLLNDLAFNVL